MHTQGVHGFRNDHQYSPEEFWCSIQDRQILYLSPHPDDMGLSNGGCLARKPAWARLHVLTIFSASVYAPNLSAHQQEACVVTTKRLQDEQTYCNRIGVNLINLGWPDSSLRGYSEEEENGSISDADTYAFKAITAISEVLHILKPQVIFCPLAIGNHVDHQIVRNAWSVLNCLDEIAFYYEDLPYAAACSLDNIEHHVPNTMKRPLAKFYIKIPLHEKQRLLRCYRSALVLEDFLGVETHARRLGEDSGTYERVWCDVSL